MKKTKLPDSQYLNDAAGNPSSKRLWLNRHSWIFTICILALYVTSFFYKIADPDTALVAAAIIGGLTGANGVMTTVENVLYWKHGRMNKNDS
jgi:uncharacterized membrane protein HdeD (DUF308 family)